MNPNQFGDGNDPNINDINNMNKILLQNQYMLMNQIDMLYKINNMNNMSNMNMGNINMGNMNMNNMNMGNMYNMNNQYMPNMGNNNNINLIFKCANQPSMTLQAKLDEKLSSIVKKYKVLICDNSDNKEFYYCNKKLCLDLTVAENGFTNNCEIEVKTIENDKELVKKKKENIFNELKKGINIVGKCGNKSCRFEKQDVISFIEGKQFEVIKNYYSVLCPHCTSIIIPKKIAFYQCSFIISGKKVSGDYVVPFSLNNIIESKDGNFFYLFDPEYDKSTTYVELNCQILNKY
jgi:hypothetical protein